MTDPYSTDANWPTEYNTCRVQGKWVNLLGAPMSGTVSFTPLVDSIVASTSQVIIVPATITATLDSNGRIDIFIPATDDPDIQPYGFLYQVKENWAGGRTYTIAAPYSGIENLADLQAPTEDGSSIAIAGFQWEMVHGETRRWDVTINAADGSPLLATLTLPTCEWRRGIRSTDPIIVKFGTSTTGALATGTISISGNVITLILDTTQSVNVPVGKYYFDLWVKVNGGPVRLTPGIITVEQNTTTV